VTDHPPRPSEPIRRPRVTHENGVTYYTYDLG
jgi:hypothetical protein